MNDPLAKLRAELDREELSRQALFRIYNDLYRQTVGSEDFEAHRLVAEAYQAFLRSWLRTDEQYVVHLENRNAELLAELNEWRQGIRRPS